MVQPSTVSNNMLHPVVYPMYLHSIFVYYTILGMYSVWLSMIFATPDNITGIN